MSRKVYEPVSIPFGKAASAGRKLRILVYPHDLAIGGSQINAIDLAAGVAAAGHDVMIYGIEGPLVTYIQERGLSFIPARTLRYRPSPTRIVQLDHIARRERLDLIHTYEWPSCLDAYFGAGLVRRVPLVCTVLSMSVMPQVPASIPLIMGTSLLGREAGQRHRGPVWVLEPPIDIDRDCDQPKLGGQLFRRNHGVTADEFLLVTVSRLAIDLKLDALVRAIDAVDQLSLRHPVKLIVVGDGPAEQALRARAELVNRERGRNVVQLIGPLLDPRAAYCAADLVVGMGSSALRALSFARPVVVQGESGFSEIAEPSTVPIFLQQGFYGVGDGGPTNERLVGQIRGLISNERRRRDLGDWGRALVASRFSLPRAVDIQLEIYNKLVGKPTARLPSEAIRSALRALAIEARNHDPLTKRANRSAARRTLKAAGGESWPPGS